MNVCISFSVVSVSKSPSKGEGVRGWGSDLFVEGFWWLFAFGDRGQRDGEAVNSGGPRWTSLEALSIGIPTVAVETMADEPAFGAHAHDLQSSQLVSGGQGCAANHLIQRFDTHGMPGILCDGYCLRSDAECGYDFTDPCCCAPASRAHGRGAAAICLFRLLQHNAGVGCVFDVIEECD